MTDREIFKEVFADEYVKYENSEKLEEIRNFYKKFGVSNLDYKYNVN